MPSDAEYAALLATATVRAVSRTPSYDIAYDTELRGTRQHAQITGIHAHMSPRDLTSQFTVDLQPDTAAHAVVQWVTSHMDRSEMLRRFASPQSSRPQMGDRTYYANTARWLLEWNDDSTPSPTAGSPSQLLPDDLSQVPTTTPEEKLAAVMASFETNLAAVLTRAQQVPAPEISQHRSIRIKAHNPVPAPDTLFLMRGQYTATQDEYGQLFIPFGALVSLGMPDSFVEYVTAAPPLTPHDVSALEENGTVYTPDPARNPRLQAIGITEDMLRPDAADRLRHSGKPPTYGFAPIGLIVNPGAVHVVLEGHILPISPNSSELAARFDRALKRSPRGAAPEDLLSVSPMESDLRYIIADRLLEGTLSCKTVSGTLRYLPVKQHILGPPLPQAAHAAHVLVEWTQLQDADAAPVVEHLLAQYLSTALRAMPEEMSRIPSHILALALSRSFSNAHLGLPPELLAGPLPDITRSHAHLRVHGFQPARIALNPQYRLPDLAQNTTSHPEQSL